MFTQLNSEVFTEGRNASTDSRLDYDQLRKAARVLRSVNHPLRQSILKLLEENGRMTVTELYIRLRLEQSVASQHLAILRNTAAVKTERVGKFIYYSPNYDRLHEIVKSVNELVV